MDETRALLDALMGPNRNSKKGDEKAKSGEPEFAERSVCKDFLVGFCCRDWFSIPKRQLDPCTKIHSDFLKEQFEAHPEKKKYRAWYEEEFLAYLERVASDCDQFIHRERGKCRPKSAGKPGRLPPDVKEKVEAMEENYAALIRKAEDLVEQDKMKESKEHTTQAIVLKEQIDELKSRHGGVVEFAGEDICEVCGVKYPLGSGGAEWHDKESHKKGKLHQGFAQIREKIVELRGRKKSWEKYASEKRAAEKARDEERAKEKEQERKKAREREKEKEKEERRERERVERKRQEEREREKEREKERARQREKEKEKERERETEKEKERAKEKERDRSRNRERSRTRRRSGERSASGGAKERGRSRSRSRSRSRDRATAKPDDQSSGEESVDAISVSADDMPEFWDKLQGMSGEVRADTLTKLSPATTERLETYLHNKVSKKKKAKSS